MSKAKIFYESINNLKNKKYQKALDGCLILIDENPEYAKAYLLLSQITLAIGKHKLALNSILKAIFIEPNLAAHHIQLGRCFKALGNVSKAIDSANEAMQCDKLMASDLDAIGTLFYQCNEHSNARNCHQMAANKSPKNIDYLFNLASSQQSMGNLKESVSIHQRVLEFDPRNISSRLALSRLSSSDSNSIDKLLAVQKAKPLAVADSIKIHYALAKEYEDKREYEKSFHHLSVGSQLKRKTINYDVNHDVEIIRYIKEVYSDDLINDGEQGYGSEEPIFIVGMPRSGTTLVERIISNHSDVHSAGEMHNFRQVMIHKTQHRPSNSFIDQTLFKKILNHDFKALGKSYIDSTRPNCGSTKRFTDKLPMNALLCGIIQKALPRSRIIELVRNPVDVCYSNYKMLFKHGYEYSYQLDDLAKFYIEYKKLMDHWQTVLPNKILQVSYEELVANQKQETRRILDFCDLKWESKCLDFHTNKQPTSTASSVQVRSPMYSTSINRWKHYEPELAPLIKHLESAGIV